MPRRTGQSRPSQRARCRGTWRQPSNAPPLPARSASARVSYLRPTDALSPLLTHAISAGRSRSAVVAAVTALDKTVPVVVIAAVLAPAIVGSRTAGAAGIPAIYSLPVGIRTLAIAAVPRGAEPARPTRPGRRIPQGIATIEDRRVSACPRSAEENAASNEASHSPRLTHALQELPAMYLRRCHIREAQNSSVDVDT